MMLMGHASVSTTMIYTRAGEADLRSAVEKLAMTRKDKN
jgi:site-specific recombinase XerD